MVGVVHDGAVVSLHGTLMYSWTTSKLYRAEISLVATARVIVVDHGCLPAGKLKVPEGDPTLTPLINSYVTTLGPGFERTMAACRAVG